MQATRSSAGTESDSPWPFRLAVALVAATFPLIWVGGLVTTTDAGMAVPDWPTTFGYNLFLYPWQAWFYGPWNLFVEHGHRMLGALVGLMTIVLTLVVWIKDDRRWIRWLCAAALAGVIGQGVLGGLRVLRDDRALAMVHGCTGPAFFGLTVTLAVCLSRGWRSLRGTDAARSDARAWGSRVLPLALLTLVLCYGQVVLGAVLRHMPPTAGPDMFVAAVLFHVGIAGALWLQCLWLAWLVRRVAVTQTAIWLAATAPALLVTLQVLLGAGTWLVNYGWPAIIGQPGWTAGYTIQASSPLQTHVVTAHVAIGSLLLASLVVVALRAARAVALQSSRNDGHEWITDGVEAPQFPCARRTLASI